MQRNTQKSIGEKAFYVTATLGALQGLFRITKLIIDSVGSIQTGGQIVNEGWIPWIINSWWSGAIVCVSALIGIALIDRKRTHGAIFIINHQLNLEIERRWASPIRVTIINRSSEYPAYIATAHLFGITVDGKTEKLVSARNGLSKIGCDDLPSKLEASRKMRICFGGVFDFPRFKKLFAEVELENGTHFKSNSILPPEPPKPPS